MNSLYDFIVKPVGDKYTNTIKVGDKDLVVNTKIENWKFVNRLAEVIETPLAFKSGIKKGDIIGKYSYPWDKIKLKNKCKNNECWKYVFCQDKKDNSHCWLGLDIKGSIIRNIQPIYERKGKIGDASTSRFNINSVFQIKNKEIYVLATSNIKPNKEIFASYKI